MTEENKKIYIDIDSVLDTRFSMLYKLDNDMLGEIYTNNEYDERIINEFGYIPSNVFNNLYTYRTKEILKMSYFTNILKILNIEIGYLKNNLQLLDLNKPITIDVNVYPYNLTVKEKNDMRIALLNVLNMSDIFINIIDIDHKLLYPNKIDIEYATLIMYNGMEWFNYMLNIEAFKNNNIPLVNLIVPALLHNPVLLKNINSYEKMFEDIAKYSGMFINMKFTPVKYFNVKM